MELFGKEFKASIIKNKNKSALVKKLCTYLNQMKKKTKKNIKNMRYSEMKNTVTKTKDSVDVLKS